MPYGESNASGGGTRAGIASLGKELLDDIIPLVEKNYRTLPGRDNRAIAGPSMGGGQAFTIGLDNLDQFAWVGEFSSGLLSDADFRIEKYMPSLVENAPAVNQRLKLLFLSCGTEDARYQGQLDLRDSLARYNDCPRSQENRGKTKNISGLYNSISERGLWSSARVGSVSLGRSRVTSKAEVNRYERITSFLPTILQ